MDLKEAAVRIARDYRGQTTGCLRHGDDFCWTGALCDIYRLETGDGTWEENGVFLLGGERHAQCTPDAVDEYFGLARADAADIAHANDNAMTMQELSDLVVEWYDTGMRQRFWSFVLKKRGV